MPGFGIFATVPDVPPEPSTKAAPLSGVRVLDFTMNLPGPYATMVLASMGAEVIKVEPPRGDTARNIGRLFDIVNAGKKSVVVDLKDPGGRARIEPLLASADVVIEGFRPGVMDAFGLGAAQLRANSPRLVYCSVSGFGQTGPYRDYPAHDLNLQAITGVCHMMRDSQDHPWGCALPIADFSSGLTAVASIVAALYARERNGEGRVLDVALADTVLSWAYAWQAGLDANEAQLSTALPATRRWLRKTSWLSGLAETLEQPAAGDRVDRIGSILKRTRPFQRVARLRLHALPHYAVYQTRDGRWLSVGIVDENKFWRAMCHGLQLPRFIAGLPAGARLAAAGPLRRWLGTAFRRRDLDQWLEHFDRANVPVAPVLPLSEALRDPQLQTRIRGPLGAAVPAALVPADRTEVSPQVPTLGEHNPHLLGP